MKPKAKPELEKALTAAVLFRAGYLTHDEAAAAFYRFVYDGRASRESLNRNGCMSYAKAAFDSFLDSSLNRSRMQGELETIKRAALSSLSRKINECKY